MNRRDTGILGEKLARDFLLARGFEIRQANYRCSEGEIDLVAKEGDTLVFVEVRARHGREFGTPEESITPAKMRRLRAASARYLQEHDDLPTEWRIDVVAIELDSDNRVERIELIENAVDDA